MKPDMARSPIQGKPDMTPTQKSPTSLLRKDKANKGRNIQKADALKNVALTAMTIGRSMGLGRQRLCLYQFCKGAVLGKEGFMSSGFDRLAIRHDHDLVGIADRGKPVGDDNGRAALS